MGAKSDKNNCFGFEKCAGNTLFSHNFFIFGTINLKFSVVLILLSPIIILLLAAFALIFLLFRRYRTALVLFVLAVVLNVMTEQIPLHIQHPVPEQKAPEDIRVLVYNVCGKVSYVPNHGPEFIDYVRDVDADLLFLPENCVGTSFELERMLKKQYPHSLHDFPEFEAMQSNYPDQTLYSRYPLRDFKRYRVDLDQLRNEYPFMDSAAIAIHGADLLVFEATARIKEQDVTLVHVHLKTNGVDGAKDEATGRRSLVRNLYEGLRFGYAFRSLEARVVADSLRNCPNPLLICGDFNDFSGSYSLSTIQNARRYNVHHNHRDRLRDAWWEGGCGFGFTFNDQHLLLRLDHVLFSRDFELQSISVHQVPYSDHLPLICDFALH